MKQNCLKIMEHIRIENVNRKVCFLLLIFALCYTFIHSSGGMTDISNHDYLYYMHLCDDSNYSRNPMISGTLLFYKPLLSLFGNAYWMWQKFHWILNLLTLFLPYFVLLNRHQRRKYFFVSVMFVFIALFRMGCEPPRLVYFILSVSLTSLIKYSKDKRFIWIIIISICMSLIAYIRFPSLFVSPLVAFAVVLLANKMGHRITILLLPIISFLILVSLTSGSTHKYFIDLFGNFNDSASGSHSMKLLLLACIQSVVCYIIYTIVFLAPFILFRVWKNRNQKLWGVLTFVSFFIVLLCIFYHPESGAIPEIHFGNIAFPAVFYHPIPQLFGPFFAAVVFYYLLETNFHKDNVVLGLTVIFSSMLASTGSDFGFIHGYMSIAFLPFFASEIPSLKIKEENSRCENTSLRNLFACMCSALVLSTFVTHVRTFCQAFYEGGRFSAVNAVEVSPNLKNVYFNKQTFVMMADMQNEYKNLIKSGDVVFWGWWAHYMSLANNKWPITSEWNITSEDVHGKAFMDLKHYVMVNYPSIIDSEKNMNTEIFLTSQGYTYKDKGHYRVYTQLSGDK